MEASIRLTSLRIRLEPVRNENRNPFWNRVVLGTTVLGFSNIRLKTLLDCGRVQDKASCARLIPTPCLLYGRQGQSMLLGCILAETVRAKGAGVVLVLPRHRTCDSSDFARRGCYTGASVGFHNRKQTRTGKVAGARRNGRTHAKPGRRSRTQRVNLRRSGLPYRFSLLQWPPAQSLPASRWGPATICCF